MASIRHALQGATRARALVALQRHEEAPDLPNRWRTSPDINWVRFVAGDSLEVLRRTAADLMTEFSRSGDEAVGVAAVLAAQAFVLARLDEEAAA